MGGRLLLGHTSGINPEGRQVEQRGRRETELDASPANVSDHGNRLASGLLMITYRAPPGSTRRLAKLLARGIIHFVPARVLSLVVARRRPCVLDSDSLPLLLWFSLCARPPTNR